MPTTIEHVQACVPRTMEIVEDNNESVGIDCEQRDRRRLTKKQVGKRTRHKILRQGYGPRTSRPRIPSFRHASFIPTQEQEFSALCYAAKKQPRWKRLTVHEDVQNDSFDSRITRIESAPSRVAKRG